MEARREPVWLREDVVRAIHRRQLSEHGGLGGLRDANLLASALARPRNRLAYADSPPDRAALAAAYAWGLARNHPFVDGNKRVALVAARTFLRLNGSDLIASQEEKVTLFLRLAAGVLEEADLAAWVRARLVSMSCHLP